MKRSLVLVLLAIQFGLTLNADEPAATVKDAFANGRLKGTIGSYYEYVDKDADDKNTTWATGYIFLKYQTAEWNRFYFGTAFLGHNQLHNDADDGSDPYAKDIETRYAMPEAYLGVRVGEKSHIVAGRYNHKKITHIDDAQSEGAYVQIKDIPNVELNAGFMQRFAEIDYDDGEDFGRTNDSQDLTANEDTGDVLLWVDGRVKVADGMLKFNPYFMAQDDYASVYGMDTDVKIKAGDDVSFGGRVDFYHVASDVTGTDDSNNYAVSPFVGFGPVTLTAGYAKFDDGNSLNKPNWLKDGLVGELDQDKAYGLPDCEVYFAKAKVKFGNFWAHAAVGQYEYELGSSGDGSQELELQLGYKFTKNFDANLRLFDVSYDNVNDKDYQKMELRIRYKF